MPITRAPRLAATLLLLAPAIADAQVLRGTVRSDLDDRPIPQVHLSVTALPSGALVLTTATGSDGRFELYLPEGGTYRVHAQALGYAALRSDPLEIASGLIVDVELRLRPDAVAITPLRVVATRREPFFMPDIRYRQSRGYGRFILRDQLDQRQGSRLQDVLRDTGLWITEVHDGNPGPPPVLVTARLRATAGRECYATMYLNGVRQFAMDWENRHQIPGEELERLRELFIYRPDEIEAIEIYRGAAEVPGEYSGSTAQCGVVAVWLRSGYDDMPVRGDFAGPVPQMAVGVAAGSHGFSGADAPARATGAEAAVYRRMRTGMGVGVRLRYTSPEMSAASTAELMRATPVPAPGPRPVRILTATLEPRLVLFEERRVRPVVTGRLSLARRSFSVPEPYVEHRRSLNFRSQGWGWGGSAGIELSVASRLGVEAAVVSERLHFSGYRELDTRSRSTASVWRTSAFRLGVVVIP